MVLGRDIGRPGQTLRATTSGALTPDQVDMRTMVLIGSSTTCTFPACRRRRVGVHAALVRRKALTGTLAPQWGHGRFVAVAEGYVRLRSDP